MDIADPRKAEVMASFPYLGPSDFEIRSLPDRNYNCIAYAAGQDKQWWWPTMFWPKKCARVETIDAFVETFGTIGYKICEDTCLEEGYEKVALYASNQRPKHAARQLENGNWVSKLGVSYDIEHNSLDSLSGRVYGSVVCVLKRPRIS
ncbi:MAG: hypothetical protein ABFD90_21480 [Phycisphaerales bacterium]